MIRLPTFLSQLVSSLSGKIKLKYAVWSSIIEKAENGPPSQPGRKGSDSRAACMCVRERGEYAPSKQQSAGLVNPSKIATQRSKQHTCSPHAPCVCAKYVSVAFLAWAVSPHLLRVVFRLKLIVQAQLECQTTVNTQSLVYLIECRPG